MVFALLALCCNQERLDLWTVPNNPGIRLVVSIGAWLAVASGMATLLWLIISVKAATSASWWCGLVVIALALSAPWQATEVFAFQDHRRELKGFEIAGPEQIRLAAKDLISSAANKTYEEGWYGRVVPDQDVPTAIREFVPKASLVTIDSEGVFLTTASSRGPQRRGYLIVLAGDDHIPESGRRVADGIYFVERP